MHPDSYRALTSLPSQAETITVPWWIVIPFALLLIVAGVGTFVGIVTQFRRGDASERWPTAPGRVLSSRVRESWGGRRLIYEPEVTYEYTVREGPTLRGDCVRFGEIAHDTARDARKIAARYPVGATVQVRYDPRDPSRSTLEPGVGPRVRLGIGAGAALALAALGLALLLIEVSTWSWLT